VYLEDGTLHSGLLKAENGQIELFATAGNKVMSLFKTDKSNPFFPRTNLQSKKTSTN
jgi:hypothetical protein